MFCFTQTGCKDGALVAVPLGRKATSFSHKFSRLSSMTAEKRRPSVSPLSPSTLQLRPALAPGAPGADAAYHLNYQVLRGSHKWGQMVTGGNRWW